MTGGELSGRYSVSRRKPVEPRFWAKVEKRDIDDCWLWTGQIRNTYGKLWNGEREVSAHRFSYELEHGPIPDGLVIDHRCRNRLCVNPAHLDAVTNRENVLRGVGRTARQARQTHCIHGHEFTPENTYIGPTKGDRQCRTCKREHNLRRRAS
jgi:hypothetical protein